MHRRDTDALECLIGKTGTEFFQGRIGLGFDQRRHDGQVRLGNLGSMVAAAWLRGDGGTAAMQAQHFLHETATDAEALGYMFLGALTVEVGIEDPLTQVKRVGFHSVFLRANIGQATLSFN